MIQPQTTPQTLQNEPQKKTKRKKNIAPGPKGHFLMGSLLERRTRPLSLFLDNSRIYGDIVRFEMGPPFAKVLVHLINSPEYFKHVLQDHHKNYIKGFGYDKLEPFLGNGLLLSEGSFWHRQRKLAQPAFHRQRLIEFSKTITDCTASMMNRIRKMKTIELVPEMHRLTMACVSKTLLSQDLSGQSDQVGQALHWLFEESNRRILSITSVSEKISIRRRLRTNHAIQCLDQLVYGLISERRNLAKTNPHEALPHDLLTMLMLAKDEDTGESMSDQELRDEIMIIFIAGHETTASALSWTFGLLAQHPDVQKKLRDEIVEVLGPDFKHPTFEDMAKLPYTQAIIQESMRIYPPAWIFSRQAKQDDCIGGYDIPKDSIVVMSPYVMHRNLNYWKDPEKFNPDRFLEKTNDQALLDSIPKHAYVPFGGGPRVCIGSGFAMMEAILVLAQVTQTLAFRFSSQDQKIEPEPLVTLRPKGKMKMEVSLY